MSEDEVEVIEQSEKDDRKKESEEYSEKEIEEIERKGMPTLESIKAATEWKVPEKLEHLLKVTKELMKKINNKEWEKEGENILCEGAKRMEELRLEREYNNKEDVKMQGEERSNEDKEEEWRDI